MLPKILREISDTNSIVVVSLAQPGAALSIKKSGIRVIKGCRRRRDSNPRYAFGAYNGLANRRLQPLGHVSVRRRLENRRFAVNGRPTREDGRQTQSWSSVRLCRP